MSNSFNDRFVQTFQRRLHAELSEYSDGEVREWSQPQVAARNEGPPVASRPVGRVAKASDGPMEALALEDVEAVEQVFPEWLAIISETSLSTALWKTKVESIITHNSDYEAGCEGCHTLLPEERREAFFLGGGIRCLLRKLELPHHELVASPWNRRESEWGSSSSSMMTTMMDPGQRGGDQQRHDSTRRDNSSAASARRPAHEILLSKTFGIDDFVPFTVNRGLLSAGTATRIRNAMLTLASSAPIYLYCGALFTMYFSRRALSRTASGDTCVSDKEGPLDMDMEGVYSALDDFRTRFHAVVRASRSTSARTGVRSSLLALPSLAASQVVWVHAADFRQRVRASLLTDAASTSHTPIAPPALMAHVNGGGSRESYVRTMEQDGGMMLLITIAAEAFFDCCVALWTAYPSQTGSQRNANLTTTSPRSGSDRRVNREGQVPAHMLENVMTFYVKRLKEECQSVAGRGVAPQPPEQAELPRDETSAPLVSSRTLRVGTLMTVALQRPIAVGGGAGGGESANPNISGLALLQRPPPRLLLQRHRKRGREPELQSSTAPSRVGSCSSDTDEDDEDAGDIAGAEGSDKGVESKKLSSSTPFLRERLLQSHTTALASSVLTLFAIPPPPQAAVVGDNGCSSVVSVPSSNSEDGMYMSESRFRAGNLQWFTLGDVSLNDDPEDIPSSVG